MDNKQKNTSFSYLLNAVNGYLGLNNTQYSKVSQQELKIDDSRIYEENSPKNTTDDLSSINEKRDINNISEQPIIEEPKKTKNAQILVTSGKICEHYLKQECIIDARKNGCNNLKNTLINTLDCLTCLCFLGVWMPIDFLLTPVYLCYNCSEQLDETQDKNK